MFRVGGCSAKTCHCCNRSPARHRTSAGPIPAASPYSGPTTSRASGTCSVGDRPPALTGGAGRNPGQNIDSPVRQGGPLHPLGRGLVGGGAGDLVDDKDFDGTFG